MSKQTNWDPYRGRSPRDIPAYNTVDAAHYLWIPENTIRAWAFGRPYPTRTHGRAWTSPLIEVADPRKHLLSFVNLLEIHVLDAIRRDHRVEMRKIRTAVEYLRKSFGTPHPLVDEAMETDGKNLFVDKYGSLINVSQHGQLAMKAMLETHLKRIERDNRGLAIRLYPFTRKRREPRSPDEPRIIAIDPTVAFGRPVIAGSGVPTVEIAERFKAGEAPSDLARDFGRREEEVLEAIRCELEAA